MDFLVAEEELLRLQQDAKAHAQEPAHVVALAWHQRQRNSQLALQLCSEAQSKLPTAAACTNTSLPLLLRIDLIRAEIEWLSGKLESAALLASQVLQRSRDFRERAFILLEADANWLLGSLHNERGQFDERDGHWAAMKQLACSINDNARCDYIDACIAGMISFRSPKDAEALAARYFSSDLAQWNLATRAAIYDFLGLQVRMGSDLGRAAAYWMHAYDAACKTGQIRRAIISASNVGNLFSQLNDPYTALEWTETGLKLARPNGWPYPISSCLLHTSNCLRQLGKIDAAQEMLQEALDILVDLQGSRNYAIALWFLGDLALARQDYPLALDAFCRLQERADALCHEDFQTNSRRGQAQALAALERYDEALKVAQEAIAMAITQDDVQGRIETLKVIAKIYDHHRLPPPPHMQESTPQLHFLMQALRLANDIEGFTIPGELLDAIADAHAAAGNFGRAFAFGRRANSAREKTHNLAASNRANALQVQHQAERARVESEHLRQLAQEQEQRAQVLQNTSTTLAQLGTIGREITAQLDLTAVCETIQRHVNSLLDAGYFVIYLMDADAQSLHSIFRMQNGKTLPQTFMPIANPHSYAARCVRERIDVLVALEMMANHPAMSLDARPTSSAMFGLLTIGTRILGVMSLQSEKTHAYGEREEMIFRNLCAYGAIAIDNADAYSKLQVAQRQLVEHEKLAALGSLVAGVAHELNTPLGNSLVTASGLQDKTNQLDSQLRSKQLHLSELQNYVGEMQEGMGMILRSLQTAANLVVNFKQVAADRTNEQRRSFDLMQTTHEVVATLMSQIRAGGHSIHLDIDPTIHLESYPGAYGQVLTSLISNAVAHAFAGREKGAIHLIAKHAKAGTVLLHFRDNGTGIAQHNLKHIFDPFFTTRLGQGGNGLGLSISYNLVTSVLQGQITVESTLGSGTEFTLELPLLTKT